VAPARFYSATYRLFKLEELESACEDYGQAVRYLGGVESQEAAFALDGHHVIEAGRVFPVCGNSYSMLHDTRFAPHFAFYGDRNRHYGAFRGCGGGLPFDEARGEAAAAPCC
jgi:hypothetical protein